VLAHSPPVFSLLIVGLAPVHRAQKLKIADVDYVSSGRLKTLTKPRFRPAQVVQVPRTFGRDKDAVPVWVEGWSEGEMAWAWYQHRMALAVRAELEARPLPLRTLAGAINETKGWLERKLRGQAPADLGAMFEWALRLGIHVLPLVQDRKDLLPLFGAEAPPLVAPVTVDTARSHSALVETSSLITT